MNNVTLAQINNYANFGFEKNINPINITYNFQEQFNTALSQPTETTNKKRNIIQISSNENQKKGKTAKKKKMITYAVPINPDLLTPKKKFACKAYTDENDTKKIRIVNYADFKKEMDIILNSSKDSLNKPHIFYRALGNEKQRYIGTSTSSDRPRSHCRESEDKKVQKQATIFHKTLNEDPNNFNFGVLGIVAKEQIPKEERNMYLYIKGAAAVEEYLIKTLNTLHDFENNPSGMNMKNGGGGVREGGKARAKRKLFD